jgi:DNA-binding transcriptional MerR regulator
MPFKAKVPFKANRLYYKIGDVCEIVGVEGHVLRFWESEFPELAPPKNKGGQRTYRPKDIELLLRIKKLLYEDRFTIAGARMQLAAGKASGAAEPAAIPVRRPRRRRTSASAQKKPTDRISEVRKELQNILTLLERR